ncbi:MAG: hypothetical protein ACI9O6_003567 [Glaciecola sp.]|jgi:hypothetical protein
MRNKILVILMLLISSQAQSSIIGNDVIDRVSVDGATYINFVDTTLMFTEDSVIESWDIWVRQGRENAAFAFQIYRATSNANEFMLIAENMFSSGAGSVGLVNLAIANGNQIQAQAGDFIGWWFGGGAGVFEYDANTSDQVNWKYENTSPTGSVNVGDTVVMASGQRREYSISANARAVPEPSFIALFALGIIGLTLSARKK